jgi:hypothetical protein
MQTTKLVRYGRQAIARLAGGLAAAVFAAVVPATHAAQFHLRYEWSASLAGPFAAIPPDMLKVQADGSVTVATPQPQGFFRLLIADGTGPAGGGIAPIRPLGSVPAATLDRLRRFVTAVAEDGSKEAVDWTGVSFAPFVTPVTSAWNDTGEPDLVEIKLVAPCETPARGAIFANSEGQRRPTDRGFILASLTRKLPPIVGYATDGPTQCETLLANCQGKAVHRIRRFGPMFLAAEDPDKNLVGNEGLFPAIYTDQAYADHSRPISFEWDSENPNNPRLPDSPPPATPQNVLNYGQLLEAYNNSAWLAERRQQREALIEFDWLALEGNAPTLTVTAGERKSFLDGQTFTRFSLDEEERARGATVTLGRTGGILVQGEVPGAYRLTLFPDTGLPQRHLVVVRAAGPQLMGGETGLFTTSRMWEAGAKEQQPRYSQRSDLERWCDSVGCGPVMLAIQVAWAEHNQNVPSAYWERDLGALLPIRRSSLQQIDSPMFYSTGDFNSRMMRWYDFLHDACNVFCWDGPGSAVPWDVGSTLINYANYVTGLLMPIQVAADVGGPLVGGGAGWEADGISDDWDESGVRVANAIKAGRPGGVYYLEHMHYCVAWRYRKTVVQVKLNGQVISSATGRWFRVNTGWGNQDRVWNAYDIDGCYLLNLWQKRTLP